MKRDITKHLLEWKSKKDRKPLIIMGARQVGKTYSLKDFALSSFSSSSYINFEEDEQLNKIFEKNLDPKRILNELNFYLNKEIDIKNDLLIFDEIQNCPRAITSLKYFNENIPELAICCAGSLLGLYFGTSSFPVGKVEFLKMYPMTFEEYLPGIKEEKAYEFVRDCTIDMDTPEIFHTRLWDLLKTYFITGGLPNIVELYSENKSNPFVAFDMIRDKQKNLIVSYQADIAKHSGKINSMSINKLWENIPVQLAKGQNGSSSKFVFKDVIPGKKGYNRLEGIIDWLETAGLIIKTPITNSGNLPLAAFSKESIFKLYFFDIGILGAISNLSPKTILDYDYGTYKGYFAENFIIQEFTKKHSTKIFSWRERTSEVEFLFDNEGKVIPIEIKSGWVTQAKSIKIFAGKYNPEYVAILSAKKLLIDKQNRIHRYPLYLASKFPFT